ncbi:MAG TPA: site-specific integrase [Thermomicrobiales bacterium]
MTATKARGRARKRANGEGSAYYDTSKGLWYSNVPTGHDEASGRTLFRKSRGFATRAEAEKARREALTALDAGIGRNATIPTVGAYLDSWLDIVNRSNLAPKTKAAYAHSVALTTPHIGGVPLDKLRADQLDTFFLTLREKGGVQGQGVSAKTTQNVRSALSLAFNRAVKKGLMATNPIGLTDPIPTARKEAQPLTEDQVNTLLDTTAGTPLDALWHLAVYLGLREGELLGLAWGDVDLTRGILRVRQQLQSPPTGVPFLKDLKTKNARRDLDLPPELVALLHAHRDRQRFEREQGGPEWNRLNLVFVSELGTPIRARKLRAKHAALRTRAGLPHHTIHDLRHTAATVMFSRGLALMEVSRILGHANTAITERVYVKWVPAQSGRLSAAMTGLRRVAQA